MTRNTYGPLAVFTAGGPGVPDQVIESAEGGIFSAELNGPALPVYDFSDQPIPFVTSSPTGQAQWRVDDALVGWVRIGGVSVRVSSNDAGDLLQDTASSVAASQAAQAAATAAAAAAAASRAAAESAASGGGTGGGLPAGTTLEQIPNGTSRLALTQPERDKLQGVAVGATKLLIGTTAGTAKSGDYTVTPSGIGAIPHVGGAFREWKPRPASQGYPTAAEGAQEGDVASLYQDA